MPIPAMFLLAFATGAGASLAGRRELRLSPRSAMLTRSFGAFLFFLCLVLVPITVYFYVFHGDWSLLYLVDVQRIPSAVALVAFILQAVLGALGFQAGASLIRMQRETLAGALIGVVLLATGAVVFAAQDRLQLVGSYAQFHGGFGLVPYASGEVFYGTLALGGVLLAALVQLLVRLFVGGRRAA